MSMPMGVNAANGFGVQSGPINAGPDTQNHQPPQQQQAAPVQQQQAPVQQQGVQQGQFPVQQQVQQPGQYQMPQHQMQQPPQQVDPRMAQAMELANAVQALGYDPGQVIQRIREQQQQAQAEMQRQQAAGMGINPQLMQYMTGLENQLKQVQTSIGQQRLAEAETNLTAFAKNYGVDYSNPQTRMEIRQFALDNNVNLDTAFKALYFDRIQQVSAQQAAGQQLAAMQGRAPQPLSSAVPGNVNQGPIDYLKMSDADFAAAEKAMRQQHYSR